MFIARRGTTQCINSREESPLADLPALSTSVAVLVVELTESGTTRGGTAGGAHSVVAAAAQQGPGLYEVYLAPIHSPEGLPDPRVASGMIMIDPGSDTNFIKHEFAKQLGLEGERCQFRLKVVDRDARPIKTARYRIDVEDCSGVRHVVYAMGLETITILPPDPDLAPIRELLRGYPEAVLDRPQGDVDILLGLRNSALHGSTEEQWGNL